MVETTVSINYQCQTMYLRITISMWRLYFHHAWSTFSNVEKISGIQLLIHEPHRKPPLEQSAARRHHSSNA